MTITEKENKFRNEFTQIFEAQRLPHRYKIAGKVLEMITEETTAILPVSENDHGNLEISHFDTCDFLQICNNGMGTFPLIKAD